MIKNINTNRPWGGAGLVLVFITIFTGLAYVILQVHLKSKVEDPIFIGLIMANAYAIYRFTIFLKHNLQLSSVAYERSLLETNIQFTAHTFMKEIFDGKKSFFIGIIFGMVFLVMVILLSPWKDLTPLNYALAVFLFVANILTGMALFSLAIYFKYSFLIGSNIKVDLWDRSGAAISSLIDTNQYIVLAVAFSSCVAIISILFSIFELDFSIFVFTLFSVSIIILTYVVPLMPITTQLWAKKKLVIEELGEVMQQEYNRVITIAKNENSTLDTSRFDSLTALLKTIKSIKAFPPIGEHSVNTAILATLLTMLPSIIDFLLKL